ncbi:antibiotic biosynthesis monooxygenase [Mycolicibacterium houstonense]|uniref:antibiotic biosynthesis monooxygenase n=1 Tax=Mycolicibacterium houstonense TaxID=146021 RepID=UPI00082FDD45|nr:antibiotic biosynthesis monooxygenase [Mycolicibacterium houstonense]
MYARSTTVQAQPEAIDAGIAHVRDEVMPAIREIDGCVGISLLVDRESCRCIATTAWETEDAMHASAERAAQLRARAAEAFGGTATVEEWEIAVLHRDHRTHEGVCVRATWAKLEPGQIDGGIEHYKAAVLPALEDLDGFCSASLMIDRASGRGVSCASFDSREAMERSRDRANALKASAIRDIGAEETDECEFELALAHLRVPESA